jgi:hypothetical protein
VTRDVLGERYEVLGLLGTGAFGRVFHAMDRELGRQVAIKEVALAAANEEVRARLDREARAASRVRHPNLVEVLDVGVAPDGAPFLVMEYVPGVTLESLLEEPVDPTHLLPWAQDLAAALAAMHGAGIVHRDVKPANVLIHEDGRAMLTDLGLVRSVEATLEELTRTGAVPGTPLYLPPEVFRDARSAGPEGDLFALGSVIYRALYGISWRGDDELMRLLEFSQRDARPALAARFGKHPAWDPWLARLLHEDPAERLGPASEVEAILAELERGGGPVRQASASGGSNRRGVAAAGLALAGAAVMGWMLLPGAEVPHAPPASTAMTDSQERTQLFSALVEAVEALPKAARGLPKDQERAQFRGVVDVRTPMVIRRMLTRLQEVLTQGPPREEEPWFEAVYGPLGRFFADVSLLGDASIGERLQELEQGLAPAAPRGLRQVQGEIYDHVGHYVREAERAGRVGRHPWEDVITSELSYRAHHPIDGEVLAESLVGAFGRVSMQRWRLEILRQLSRLTRLHIRIGVSEARAEELAEALLAKAEGLLHPRDGRRELSFGELRWLVGIDLFLRSQHALRGVTDPEATRRGRLIWERARAVAGSPRNRWNLANGVAKEAFRLASETPRLGSQAGWRPLLEEVEAMKAWEASGREGEGGTIAADRR